MKFADLQPKLSSATLEAIQSFGFVSATPVQASTIPLFMQHKVGPLFLVMQALWPRSALLFQFYAFLSSCLDV